MLQFLWKLASDSITRYSNVGIGKNKPDEDKRKGSINYWRF